MMVRHESGTWQKVSEGMSPNSAELIEEYYRPCQLLQRALLWSFSFDVSLKEILDKAVAAMAGSLRTSHCRQCSRTVSVVTCVLCMVHFTIVLANIVV